MSADPYRAGLFSPCRSVVALANEPPSGGEADTPDRNVARLGGGGPRSDACDSINRGRRGIPFPGTICVLVTSSGPLRYNPFWGSGRTTMRTRSTRRSPSVAFARSRI